MKNAKIIKSVGVVGGFTLLSRGLGLVRDVLMAGFFGTSVWMSAFVVAFTIPNLFRRLFGEGALSAAFVPIFVESRQKDGDESAWMMARKVVTLVACALIVLVAVGILAITLTMRFAPLSEKAALTLLLTRIMLPYAVFICLAALGMAMLNSFHHFAMPAAAPCLLNVIWITTVLIVGPRWVATPERQITAVAWAVIIAGIVQVGMQAPMLVRYGYRPGFSLDWKDARVVRMLKLMGPAALGMAVTQFNVLIDRLLAIWIGTWAPAALFFSERMIYFPLGIFATAMSTVLLPTFSSHAARADHGELNRTLNHSLRNLLFVMIPAAVGLLVLARPLIQMLFGWGHFTAQSVDLTAVALRFYAPGLVVFSLAKIFVPAFYSMQDTRTPVRIGLWTVLINLVLNITFVLTWPLYLKHAGLALATVLAESFYAITLAVLLHRRIGSPGWKQIGASVARCSAAALVMGYAVVIACPFFTEVFQTTGMSAKLVQITAVLFSVILGMLLYLISAGLLRSPELKDIRQALRRR